MDWQPILTNLVAALVPIGVTAIATAISIGVKYFSAYMTAKTSTEKEKSRTENLKRALLQLSQATVNAVMDTEAQVRKFMVDGKLSKEEQDQLRCEALTRIQTQVPAALQTLVDAGYRDLTGYVNGEIEKAVSWMPESTTKPDLSSTSN